MYPFRIISDEPYTITLPPYGFLWFDLVPEDRLEGVSIERVPGLRTLASTWLGLHGVVAPERVEIVRDRVLRPGRPGLLDVVARVDGRLAHFVVGLRGVADEPHFLRPARSAPWASSTTTRAGRLHRRAA